MNAVVEQWLGDSRHAIHHLEQEMSGHQIAIQQAMAAIRGHTEMINHLQHHLEIIRRATVDIDTEMGEAEFESSFSKAFGEHYAELESIEPSDSEMLDDGPVPQDESSTSQVVLRVMQRERGAPVLHG